MRPMVLLVLMVLVLMVLMVLMVPSQRRKRSSQHVPSIAMHLLPRPRKLHAECTCFQKGGRPRATQASILVTS
jgi:hypothetical protein